MTGSDATTALIVVDMQNDFSHLLAPALARTAADAGIVVATHRAERTAGAERHPSVAEMRFDREARSGFGGTDLGDYLRGRGVMRVVIAGVATDDRVRATALDAIREGFETTVLIDAVAAVDVAPGDGVRALAEVSAAGGGLDRLELLRDEAALEPILERKAEQLRDVMKAAGRGRAVIGLSGGIDSAVAMALAARALGPEAVIAVRLPSQTHRAGAS